MKFESQILQESFDFVNILLFGIACLVWMSRLAHVSL
jgi:hypothetical protein